MSRHDDDWIAGLCRMTEPPVEPRIENGTECEVRLLRIHDGGARIDSGLNSVALQNGEAEAMDCRGRDFTQASSPARECPGLPIAERSLPKRRLQILGHSAIDKQVDEFVDTRTKFGSGTFRESDGGDIRGAPSPSKQHRRSPGKK